MTFKMPEHLRIVSDMGRKLGIHGDMRGAFIVQSTDMHRTSRIDLIIIASVDIGWEHVSVHGEKYFSSTPVSVTPTWHEMCQVKDLFWGPEDEAFQFHPKRSEYVNLHPHTLHLWRYQGVMTTPPLRLL